MASHDSDQVQNAVAVPRVQNLPYDYQGRVRVSRFTYTTGASGDGAVANGDTINLCHLPGKAKVIGGSITFGAMGSSTTASIGYSGATTAFLSAGSVASAGFLNLAETQAKGYGYVTGADGVDLILTAGGANYADDKVIDGHIFYVVD